MPRSAFPCELPDLPAERARRVRPPGWLAPGPAPRGADGRAGLSPGPDEDLSFLSGDFRIFQHKRGHRWSLDDFMTALIAIETARAHGSVQRTADLGCGIGSVLMMIAWALPDSRAIGIEAQELSADLAQRSIAWNGLGDRCELRRGDLRDDARLPEVAAIDLVTGTPPYIPLGAGVGSDKVQRGLCCFETRGGIEDYAQAAARLVAPRGRFVACVGAFPEGRAERAVRAAGLAPVRRVDVVPRDGKQVLFRVVVAARETEVAGPGTDPLDVPSEMRVDTFVVRDRTGVITDDMHAARATLGMPPIR